MKTNPDPATVLLVGGGSIIAPSKLEGVGGQQYFARTMHMTGTDPQN